MKRFLLFLAAALTVSSVLAGFKYEGEWGGEGSGPGQFKELYGVDVAPNGNVYVSEFPNNRIQYFTATGSYLGEWINPNGTFDVAVGPQGNVYSGGCNEAVACYRYYSKAGSPLGYWYPTYEIVGGHGDVGPAGTVFGPEYAETTKKLYVARYKPNGSPVGVWEARCASKYGAAVSVSRDGKRVYVAPIYDCRIWVYTAAGSFLMNWGSAGSGPGQFLGEVDLDVDPDGRVFAADAGNHRVQFFTSTGSFLGKWGRLGSGPGQFDQPHAIAVSPDGKRVYVADKGNYRIQYFRRSDPAVSPTSIGRVKALFK